MKVQPNSLNPKGYAVHFVLKNGWTVSIRTGWGEEVSVMAWQTSRRSPEIAGEDRFVFSDGVSLVERADDATVVRLLREVSEAEAIA